MLRLGLAQPQSEAAELLYAFAVDREPTYVGKTSQGLLKRMQGYRSPAASAVRGGSTNIRNNRYIVDALASGAVVEIYVLDGVPVQHHGEFRINLAAGLEDSLIRELAPPWNW